MADEPKAAPAPAAPAGDDVEKYKVHAAVAYLWILWLVPLLAAKESKFAMFHANQGLVLFLAGLVGGIVGGFIPFIGWFIIMPLVSLAVVILAIMGIVNAIGGKMTPLPLIGGFQILK